MTAKITKRIRCAIYTRKSTEEGLEQAFNSLDAQREAAAAYVASQKHEGWELLPKQYDDGGYSGGTTDRPALQQLLADIKNKKVDVIVVYKVDRLSRSIHDFAQMMTLFDQHQVSFVSVTQQFNTTTSMGRLTLNILLSFAQFEREVTGERIRDKVAASKKKGIWMGGVPPLGYRIQDRALLIEESEVALVKKIFEGYLASHSILQLSQALNREGHTTKRWQSAAGRWHGGAVIKPSYINQVLRNPVYAGKVIHKKEIYEGQHEAIIDEAMWTQVHQSIQRQESSERHRWQSFFLLKGKLKTWEGYSMSPASAHRKRVHYYVSQKCLREGYKSCLIKNLNATRLDALVSGHVMHYLKRHHPKTEGRLTHIENDTEQKHWQRQLINAVVVGPSELKIVIDKQQIEALIKAVPCKAQIKKNYFETDNASSSVWHQPAIEDEEQTVTLTLGICIKRQRGMRWILAPDGTDLTLPMQPQADANIVTALGCAFGWRQMLDADNGLSLKQLAKRCGVHERFLTKRLSLNALAPDVVHRALSGTLPASVNLTRLYEAAENLSWPHQRQILGLAP